jgi:Uma2 family endonuclease
MSDGEFADLCAAHPDLFFEMWADGELIVMPATYPILGLRNSEINRQLANWAIQNDQGLVSDSSTGFVLLNGARRSPRRRLDLALTGRVSQFQKPRDFLASLPRLRNRVALAYR